MNDTSRIKVLGLLSLPLLALGLAIMLVTWGSSGDTAEAATDGAAMGIRVDAADTQTCPATKTGGETCVGLGAPFSVIISADAIPLTGNTPPGYRLAQVYINWDNTNLTFKPNATAGIVAETNWPDCAAAEAGLSGNESGSTDFALQGCLTGTSNPPPSTYKGDLYTFEFNCSTAKSANSINLIPLGVTPADTNGAALGASDASVGVLAVPAVTLDVNCTNSNTPTPTSTPPDIPKMSKLPALQNVWLTTQGSKIPPPDCLAGQNIGGLSETLSGPILTSNPKGDLQTVAAFEFEVHYDATKACVQLTTGDSFTTAGGICFIQDSVTKPQLEGVARIGCVTVGKNLNISATAPLAQIDVRPQPDIYSQAKPNQDNGVVVQINNVGCDLGDEQGHAIPLFSCDDADITFRYLEGDVIPDCTIDASDAQSVAFRWGSTKGSTIYRDFMNLEPSGTQADGDIDINDLQFIYGRFGSSCTAPHPPQPPVNPKALAPAPTP